MDLYRVEGVLDLTLVRQKKVVFVGCGSLGSQALESLTYPWREIVLVDPDTLDPANVERHLLGAEMVGLSKVEGLAGYLRAAGVDPATIVPHQDLIENVQDLHTDADLMIVTVDRQRYKREVSDWCHQHNVAALHGGVYPKGSGGQVSVVTNPRDACYRCGEVLQGADALKDEAPRKKDYGIDITKIQEDEGELTAVPALRAPVTAIAALISMLALEVLQGEEVTPQIYVQACNGWQPVLVFDEGPLLDTVRQYVDAQASMGLVPNAKLVGQSDGGVALLLRHGIMSLRLRRWQSCPTHATFVDESEI